MGIVTDLGRLPTRLFSRFLGGEPKTVADRRAPRKLYPEFSGSFDSHGGGCMTLELIPGTQSAITRRDGVPLRGSDPAPGDDEACSAKTPSAWVLGAY